MIPEPEPGPERAGDPNLQATLALLRAMGDFAADEDAELIAAALDLLPLVAEGSSPDRAADRELHRALAH